MSSEERIDLEKWAQEGRPTKGATRFKIRIDNEYHDIDDPTPSGRDILSIIDKKPVEEYLLFLVLRGGGFEEVRLDEKVDLTRDGAEKFMVFASSASYRFEMDGKRFEWRTKLISGLKLKEIAGVDPNKYALWYEFRDGEYNQIANEEFVDLSEEGLEKFFTVIAKTTAGDALVPSKDASYLSQHKIDHKIFSAEGHNAIILNSFPLPPEKYDHNEVDILILLPPGYPDSSPDMFYCNPWLYFKDSGSLPQCADAQFLFFEKSWQRWSRHNYEWRPGSDGIWVMIKRIECALHESL